MTGTRRLSQAISEGDGISVIVPVDGPSAARSAEDAGAEAVIVDSDRLRDVRDATELPVIWRARPNEAAREGAAAGADACLLDAAEARDDGRIETTYSTVVDEGLECVVAVGSGEELESVLELLDPEIFLLSPTGDDDERSAVERVLDLLPDVPAGKLAVAYLADAQRQDLDELERAGVDGVIVGAGTVAHLVGAAPPEV
jgi:indole-3-glycerol phosphate synthase